MDSTIFGSRLDGALQDCRNLVASLLPSGGGTARPPTPHARRAARFSSDQPDCVHPPPPRHGARQQHAWREAAAATGLCHRRHGAAAAAPMQRLRCRLDVRYVPQPRIVPAVPERQAAGPVGDLRFASNRPGVRRRRRVRDRRARRQLCRLVQARHALGTGSNAARATQWGSFHTCQLSDS